MSYTNVRYWVKYQKNGRTWIHAGMRYEEFHALVARLVAENIAYTTGEEKAE